MELNNKFKTLSNRFDIRELFALGLYHRFENVERTYLDTTGLKGEELFNYLRKYLNEKLEIILDENFYVCLVGLSEEESDNILAERIEQFNSNNLFIPKESIYVKKYIEEEERYAHYFFYKEKKENLDKYIAGSLACNFPDIKPCFYFDVFFLTSTLDKLINVYDDRGMDIMKLSW